MAPFPERTEVGLPDGRRLAVAVRPGPGTPILLLHGMTDSADSFRLMLPFLGDRHIVMPDLRGHGQSFRDDDMSLPAIADDISALIAALRLPSVTLVGHSLGAITSVWLAAHRPGQVERIVLLAGTLAVPSGLSDSLGRTVAALPDPLPPDHPFFQDWHLCERPVPDGFLGLLARQTALVRKRDWLAVIEGVRHVDLTEPAGQVRQPVLVISGSADPLFPAQRHPAMVEAFPHAAGVLLPGTGHNPHWDRPEDVARMIGDFAGVAG